MTVVVLRRPERVDDFEVELTAVEVEYIEAQAFLLLNWLITWEAVTVQEGAMLSYELSVGGFNSELVRP